MKNPFSTILSWLTTHIEHPPKHPLVPFKFTKWRCPIPFTQAINLYELRIPFCYPNQHSSSPGHDVFHPDQFQTYKTIHKMQSSNCNEYDWSLTDWEIVACSFITSSDLAFGPECRSLVLMNGFRCLRDFRFRCWR